MSGKISKQELQKDIAGTILGDFSQYASEIDDLGIYTLVEFKRTDGTLYLKSVLSNPDADGNYQTCSWTFYGEDGTTVSDVKTWTLTYENGVLRDRVVG
jgi:hypothetical protein